MIDTSDDLRLLARESELHTEIAALQAEIDKSRNDRQHIAITVDAAKAAETEKVLSEACESLKACAQALEDAEEVVTLLHSRAETDHAVTGLMVATAKEEVELARKRVAFAKKTEAQARRVWTKDASDNHLAFLAADVIEPLLQAPVFVRTRPESAPDITPRVVLSQTKSTKNYGTLRAAGEVLVSVVGEVDLPLDEIRAAFTDIECDVVVTAGHLSFRTARWPVPVLAAPSNESVHVWAREFAKQWKAHIAHDLAAYARGFTNTQTGWKGEALVKGADIVFGDGTATGTARVLVATNEPDLTLDHFRSDIASVFAQLGTGADTDMGQIEGYELADIVWADHVWDPRAEFLGTRTNPTTVLATITIRATYVPVAEKAIAND